ncbi:competence type IV pilus minor pilin ComGF [Vagococcus zengguangii]|uniref:Prepilin-type N-terminal cleavage/methylation domain-containing protein n=1 Tax=Vagococcus zengguangii TaxID=2571750 RepID=A0A4D7CRU1_9ENTE|nr:competence type IV pilus minor pilin ComGF [Vagococcus zengguangii]QCI85733.1 prepilin-type N-terminal cleavage/methylation domain-containing protein [Vagococcus zengguangii]TLG81674.1 prepilin-type N-terminal cleavage/methylation domain-containing protein [Vagococcus zengguangii]
MKRDNYQGFTLIESLYTLLVLAFILSFFQPFIRYLALYQEQSANQAEMAWQIFTDQLEEELLTGKLVACSETTIDYRNSEDSYFIIEKYNYQIRKKTVTTGHQPLLLNVASWHVTQRNSQQLYIEVTFLDGTVRSCYQGFKQVVGSDEATH